MKTRNVWILAALLCGQIGVQAQEALPKEVKVGKERIKARHEICLPQIDDYQLLKCDFHIHTIFSDGIVWPSLRVQEAWDYRKKVSDTGSCRVIFGEADFLQGQEVDKFFVVLVV